MLKFDSAPFLERLHGRKRRKVSSDVSFKNGSCQIFPAASYNLFDRTIIVTLKRRPDRLKRTLDTLEKCRWPFKKPEIFEAVDGSLASSPPEWKSGAGAWGCMRSHQRVLEMALCDGVKSLLVMEDDVCFVEDFGTKVRAFLEAVPDDWDQLMLGGQHIHLGGPPTLIKPGVYRCTDCERTHCYAVRGPFMRKLYQRWIRGGTFDGTIHCDHIMGRDPELQAAHKVYAPERFLVGQEGDASDINGRINPRQFWNPPDPEAPVIHLQAGADLARWLRYHGWHTGFARDPETDLDGGLKKICSETAGGSDDRVNQLRSWLDRIQWEVASDRTMVCTVWHPEIGVEELQRASRWPVYPVRAETVDEAFNQVPERCRIPPKIPLAHRCVVHFNGPAPVMEAMRKQGWHNGHWRTLEGWDVGLCRIVQEMQSSGEKEHALRTLLRLLQREAERLPQGVAVLWHPGLEGDLVEAAAGECRVIRIAAQEPMEAQARWQLAVQQLSREPIQLPKNL